MSGNIQTKDKEMIQYKAKCDCGATEITMHGMPKVTGYCHCGDCRELLNVPYHTLVVWDAENLEVSKGDVEIFQHPRLSMTRVHCKECGEVMYNTNKMGWKLASHLLISKNYDEVPAELNPDKHFFYGRRIIDIADSLPKYE